MYKIGIYEELKLDAYKKIIDFSLSKSDAFMLITYRYSDERKIMYSKPDRNLYDSEEEFLWFLNYFEQRKKKIYDNEVIFKNNTEPFLEKLKPYLIKKRNFPTEWPGQKVVFYNKFTAVDICVYKACDEIKPYLMGSHGLFNWRYPYLPDDLSFFKDCKCWFATVAHEGFAHMYVKEKEDIEKLKELGIDLKIEECNDEEVNLFHEDYEI